MVWPTFLALDQSRLESGVAQRHTPMDDHAQTLTHADSQPINTPVSAGSIGLMTVHCQVTRAEVYRLVDLTDEFLEAHDMEVGIGWRAGEGQDDVPIAQRVYQVDLEIYLEAVSPFLVFMVQRGFLPRWSKLRIEARP